MVLYGKTAVVYGAGGAIGSAVAHGFAAAGAEVFLTGRTQATLDAVAKEIVTSDGRARTAVVDAMDQAAVDEHAARVVAAAGGIDISFNAVGFYPGDLGVPLTATSPEAFVFPTAEYLRTHFITATTAARHMAARGSGIILPLSTTAARILSSMTGGFSVASQAIETFAKQLGAEVGSDGVRVVCLRSDGIPETARRGSHSRRVWAGAAERAGMSLDDFLEQPAGQPPRQRSLTLGELAAVAVFMASDQASAITATVVNVSCGTVIE